MPEQNLRVRHQIWTAQLLAYVLILVTAIWGFYAIGRQTDRLCDNALANRVAVRQLTSAIANLGRQLVVGDAGSAVTPEQVASLQEFREFKRRTLAKLPNVPCP